MVLSLSLKDSGTTKLWSSLSSSASSGSKLPSARRLFDTGGEEVVVEEERAGEDEYMGSNKLSSLEGSRRFVELPTMCSLCGDAAPGE